ncbi:MAG TPA: sulfite exporter TauE/SafE family protein [Pseudolabrys sp.]|jgi:hypothetical protein|nr:sulfite exporter TauE/SafE family protein [Pseudolabrys sp.]
MIAGLSYDTLAVLWIGALFGGVAAGGSGFAFGVAASAIWLHRIDPVHCALMVTGCGVLLHSTTIWPQRHHIEFGKLWPFLLGGIIGIPIGVRLLVFTDAGVLKAAIGIFLLAFGTYALLSPRLHTISFGDRAADAVIGFLGGILGGIGGYSGVLPTIWTQLRGWPKAMARAVYQPYIIVMHALALSGIVWVTSDRAGVIMVLAVLPPLLAGTWVGWQLYGKLDDRRFRQGLAVLLIVSGLTLVL